MTDQPPLDPRRRSFADAVGRLLAYWRVAWEQVERDGRRCFGEKFVSQSFDAFCGDPSGSAAGIYRAMGLPQPDLDYSRIHPARGPHQSDSPRWDHYGDLLGLPRV